MGQEREAQSPFPIILSMIGAWAVLAIAVAALGLLENVPGPPPLFALALTVSTLILIRVSAPVRAEVRALGMTPLIALHAIRIPAGLYYLWAYSRGVLPASFALPAGWGDIIVGL